MREGRDFELEEKKREKIEKENILMGKERNYIIYIYIYIFYLWSYSAQL